MCNTESTEGINKFTAIPDVAGYTLERAKKLLAESGVNIGNIKIFTQPREKDLILEYDDTFRVVKVIKSDNKTVELLVCKPL